MTFEELESKGKILLEQYPFVKRSAKRVYHFCMYALSKKIICEGNISRVSPNDEYEYYFGYYDKSPWDITDRYILCIKVKNAYKSVAPNTPAEIIIIDTENNNEARVITKINAWNVQQGCMLQWLGPEESERIIFNDFRDGKYCSVIWNIKNYKEEEVISSPVYSVSADGTFALTLDFSRLHRLRKGYGYSNLPEETEKERCPDKPCIWYVDLVTGVTKELLKYTDFQNFEQREDMVGAEHKVNHLMINPSGTRFMVLHRWLLKGRKYTRLVTCSVDGTDFYSLNDDNFTSHCYWRNDEEILAFERKFAFGDGYYLMKDKTQEFEKFWTELKTDGHCSYSPSGELIVTDTYPNRRRIASIFCIKGNDVKNIAKVFAPFRYDFDVRCDLHPRWNRAGDKICFDSVHEGKRGLYFVSL